MMVYVVYSIASTSNQSAFDATGAKYSPHGRHAAQSSLTARVANDGSDRIRKSSSGGQQNRLAFQIPAVQ